MNQRLKQAVSVFGVLFVLVAGGCAGTGGTASGSVAEDKVVYHINAGLDQATNGLRNVRNHLEVNPKIMVGGHGGVSTNASADLQLTRDYLVYLRQKMGAAADELEDFEVAYKKTDWSRFSHLPAFNEANRRNAYNTYIRIQGGDK